MLAQKNWLNAKNSKIFKQYKLYIKLMSENKNAIRNITIDKLKPV